MTSVPTLRHRRRRMEGVGMAGACFFGTAVGVTSRRRRPAAYSHDGYLFAFLGHRRGSNAGGRTNFIPQH